MSFGGASGIWLLVLLQLQAPEKWIIYQLWDSSHCTVCLTFGALIILNKRGRKCWKVLCFPGNVLRALQKDSLIMGIEAWYWFPKGRQEQTCHGELLSLWALLLQRPLFCFNAYSSKSWRQRWQESTIDSAASAKNTHPGTIMSENWKHLWGMAGKGDVQCAAVAISDTHGWKQSSSHCQFILAAGRSHPILQRCEGYNCILIRIEVCYSCVKKED